MIWTTVCDPMNPSPPGTSMFLMVLMVLSIYVILGIMPDINKLINVREISYVIFVDYSGPYINHR